MSTSPLLGYINASGIITSTLSSEIQVSNGRLVVDSNTPASRYYLRLFLKRAQSAGTSSGVTMVPNNSEIMPGYSGQSFLYRGYVIQYGIAPSNFSLGDNASSISLNAINSRPEWLTPGVQLQILFGSSNVPINAKIITSSGTYGSQGIDDIIISEISGIPIVLSAGEYNAG